MQTPKISTLDSAITLDGAIQSTGQYWQWQGHAVYYVHGDRPKGAADDRPSLLLIHGFGASTDHWKKNIAALRQDFDVWAIDLLGFGRSAKPDLQYSGDLWRSQLHDFIATVIGRPTVLAGNSLGGYAALCVGAAHPEWVAGIILLNSAGPFTPTEPLPPPHPARKVMQNAVRSLLLQPLPSFLLFQYTRRRSMIRKTLKRVYLDQTAITDELVEDIYRPSCDPGAARVFASVFKSRRGETVDQLLERLTCPLLLIWGAGDPWMNAQARSAQFRRYYPAATEHFLNAGHCPHDEVPDQVNALIRDWLTQLPTLSLANPQPH
jgi:pimeloyl-ACP methyl ester carboxylesterase